MKKNLLIFSLVFFCFSVHFIQAQDQPTGQELLNKMLQSIKKVNTLTYTLKAWERLDNGSKTQYNEMLTHFQKQPLRIYVKNFSPPNEGVEVLYKENELDGKALVNAKKWLPNLKLDPYGSQLRKDQHHTIFNTGFEYLGGIVTKALNRAAKEAKSPDEINQVFVYDGDVTWNGISCYKIVLYDPTFTYEDYVVKPGDNLNTLADRRGINAYLVIDKNDNVKWFDSFPEGEQVKLPTSYAKKTILYLDKSNMLPIVQIMHDEKGQFEKYEFHDLKVNPQFAPDQFSEDYSAYGF
ncbi:MAG: DUF1571 domain-containing protein [Chitinophagales bacterium]